MYKFFKIILRILILSTAVFLILSYNFGGIWVSMAITSATFLYHFGMRKLVGDTVNHIMHNHANYNSIWFRQKSWETKIYNLLHVKKWKDKMPTYDPTSFDSRKHSWDEIAQTMCQSEVVHEINILLSFLPIITSHFLGALPVFILTSFIAATFDLSFVIIQRYNRPRIIKIVEKQKSHI